MSEKSNLVIRAAQESDRESFRHIIIQCTKQLDSKGFHHWSKVYTPDSIDLDKQKSQTFLAQKEGVVCGCVCYNTELPEDYFVKDYNISFENQKVAYHTTLAVMPQYQNQGIGDILMDYVENLARNADCISVLSMRIQQADLLDFYKKRGYVQISRHDIDSNEGYALLVKHNI